MRYRDIEFLRYRIGEPFIDRNGNRFCNFNVLAYRSFFSIRWSGSWCRTESLRGRCLSGPSLTRRERRTLVVLGRRTFMLVCRWIINKCRRSKFFVFWRRAKRGVWWSDRRIFQVQCRTVVSITRIIALEWSCVGTRPSVRFWACVISTKALPWVRVVIDYHRQTFSNQRTHNQ